jgi:hypothetical protein
MDYNIHHKSGMIIGNLKAANDKAALKLSQRMFGSSVTISRV